MPENYRTRPLLAWQIILMFTALGTLVPLLGGIAPVAAVPLLFAAFLKLHSDFELHTLLVHLLFYCVGFGLGWLAAALTMTKPADLPPWVDQESPQRVRAVVEQVDALPGERMRIILSEVSPLALTGLTEREPPPLPAKLAWTWLRPDTEPPLPGQTIEVDLRIKRVSGMQNPGTFDIEEYWLEKGVAFRAWTQQEKGNFTVIEPAPFWQTARSRLQHRMFEALFPKNDDLAEEYRQPVTISGGKAIIPALLTGNKYYLTSRQLELFAAASLSHSLALSGLHLGLMAGMGTALAFAVCRLCPQIMLTVPRAKLAVAFAAPLVLIYLWLGGLTPSLLRSALMFACMGWLLWRGRPHIIMDGLLWALLIMLIINPTALHDLRLQLSATCIAAIALVLPYALRISGQLFPGHRRSRHYLRGITSLLIISLAIQIVLLPLQTWSFGQATPWFILNLIWLPVLSGVVFPLSVFGLLLSLIPGLEPAAGWIFNSAALPGDLLFSLLEWLDKANALYAPAVVRPAPQAALAYWLVIFVLTALGASMSNSDMPPQQREKASAQPTMSGGLIQIIKNRWSAVLSEESRLPTPKPLLLVILTIGWLLSVYCLLERWQAEHPPGPRLSLIDVGQGQAVLFEGMEGQRILVDGGGLRSSTFDVGKSVLAPALTFNRPPYLTAVINTHPDTDHIGGLVYLFQKFQIDELYLGQGLPNKEYGEYVEQILTKHGFVGAHAPKLLREGDELPLDSSHTLLTLYPPLKFSKAENTEIIVHKSNNQSIVLQLKSDAKGLAVTCGDIERSGIKNLLENDGTAPDWSLKSEVLILPHHGSKNGFNADFYDAVSPELILVSAGFGNQWGFPVPAIRAEFARRNIPLYSTSDYGQITVQWNKQGSKEVILARPHPLGYRLQQTPEQPLR